MITATATTHELVDTLAVEMAVEMAAGVDRAVECWMAQIDGVLNDVHLTTLGRMQAVKEVLEDYKRLTGKTDLIPRKC